MDQDAFVKNYFGLLAAKMAPHGYQPTQLIEAIWSGTAAMVKNTGAVLNEEAFWQEFTRIYGEDSRKDTPLFDAYYKTDFVGAKSACGFHPQAAQVVALLKEKGKRVVLATNPIFPAVATRQRIRWAGLQPEDFVLYTTYENSHYCKPNLDYYREKLGKLGVSPEEWPMVGNDVGEDMAAEALGMKVFLLTDCLINKEDRDISCYPHGSFDALTAYINKICCQ